MGPTRVREGSKSRWGKGDSVLTNWSQNGIRLEKNCKEPAESGDQERKLDLERYLLLSPIET